MKSPYREKGKVLEDLPYTYQRVLRVESKAQRHALLVPIGRPIESFTLESFVVTGMFGSILLGAAAIIIHSLYFLN